jgi:cyclopropane fatty-acyl-phospholipid synthase-like methyltransferase
MSNSVGTVDKWKNFWEGQTSPLHHKNDDKWYSLYAQEINLILDSLDYQGGAVLETGCGNGALFDFLKIDRKGYVGTDISDSMLEIFQAKHPDLELISTNSATYKTDRKFSLIFSNGVVQYFDRQSLDTYIENSMEMLAENGILILGNVLWKDLKCKQFYSSYAKYIALRFILMKNDNMGWWHSPGYFRKYDREGFQRYTYGSLFYTYRFSLAFKKVA